LQPADLHTAFVFVVLTATSRGHDIVRRVVELGFLSPAGELTLLTHQSAQGSPRLDKAGLQALATWTGAPPTEIETDLARQATHWS